MNFVSKKIFCLLKDIRTWSIYIYIMGIIYRTIFESVATIFQALPMVLQRNILNKS